MIRRVLVAGIWAGYLAVALPVAGVLMVADVVSDAVDPILHRRRVRRRMRGRR